MTATHRPRRTVLYMPGSNARALEKARDLPADALIFDLEDAVAPDAKDEARKTVLAALGAGGYGRREILVRANALSSPWGHDDIVAAARSGAHGVLLPKVESADAVRQAVAVMDAAGAPGDQTVWCMIETPRGVLKALEIAEAHRRLGGFVMGTSDLTKDLHARHTRDRLPMLPSLAHCLLAARAAGIPIIDGVHLDLDDEEGLAQSCVQGVELGFDGKTIIHPKQLARANEIFAPSEQDVVWSKKIIAAHGDAVKAGAGVVVVDGRLVENLHVENARRVVALDEAIKDIQSSS